MSRKGKGHSYSLQLIDAITKEPFKEHPGKNGMNSYFEVEPGVEYFMKFQNHSSQTVLLEFKVDGEELGYQGCCSRGTSEEYGLWSFDKNDQQTLMKALKLQKIITRPGDSKDDENQGGNTGVVEVSIYEKIDLDGYYYMNNSSSKFTGTTEVHDTDVDGTKKRLKSEHGSTKRIKTDDGRRRNRKKGKKLETIKVKYCSTVGLIIDGVLPKPPVWEWFKMRKPQAVYTGKLDVQPVKSEIQSRNENDTESKKKAHEMFDLTSV